jgi:hypothetical protein
VLLEVGVDVRSWLADISPVAVIYQTEDSRSRSGLVNIGARHQRV